MTTTTAYDALMTAEREYAAARTTAEVDFRLAHPPVEMTDDYMAARDMAVFAALDQLRPKMAALWDAAKAEEDADVAVIFRMFDGANPYRVEV